MIITITEEAIDASKETLQFVTSPEERMRANAVALELIMEGFEKPWADWRAGLIGWSRGERSFAMSMPQDVKNLLIAIENYQEPMPGHPSFYVMDEAA